MTPPELDSFVIETELIRDAISAGIWTRLCSEMRGHEEGHRVDQYIDHLSEGRGDPMTLLQYLDEDIAFLSGARGRLRTVQEAPIGSVVELDDVERFMPISWKDPRADGRGEWVYTESETEEAELLAPETVIRVRRVKSDI